VHILLGLVRRLAGFGGFDGYEWPVVDVDD
jgi:hypothetical protein